MAAVNTRADYIPPATREVEVTSSSTLLPARLRQVSWGAIIAGVAISLVCMIALNMLGLAIGASTVDPAVERNPIEPALGTGAVIWLAASHLLSMFAGGFVAGRLSGIADDFDGVLHGLVTWAIVSLLTLIFLTSSVGNVISGATSAVSSGISAVGQGIASISPEVADAIDLQGSTLTGIGTEIRNLLSNSGDAAQIGGSGDTTTPGTTDQQATTAAAQTGGAPTLTEIEVTRAVRAFLTDSTADDAAARDELVTLLSERTGISQEEAQTRVEQWEATYRDLSAEVERVARDVGQAAADAIAALAGVVFVGLLIGAFAAGAGGVIGTPDPRLVVRQTEVTSVR